MKTRYVFRHITIAIGMVLSSILTFLPAWGADVTFAWDANTEEDVEGYGLYYKELSKSEYSLYGYVVVRELSDAKNPRFLVSGLVKGKTYYFALTAFSWYGLESGFSDPVCVDVGDSIKVCPTSGVGAGGGSGGGGGGCFIDSLIKTQ